MIARPLVSVIIPTYNAGSFIETSIDSVLAQTLGDFELIVVDDGSTDDTAVRLARYGSRIRQLTQPNRGVSRARNRGIQEAQGRWVAFLDADDAWKPTKLARQVELLAGQTLHLACHTAVWLADEHLHEVELQRHHGSHDITPDNLVLYGNLVLGGGSSLLCDRECLVALGGFDEELSLCADWEMWVRLAGRSRFDYVDEPLVVYRRSPSSMSSNPTVLERDTLRLLEKTFRHVPTEAGFRSKAYGCQYRVLSGSYCRARRYSDASRCLMNALLHDPAQALYAAATPLRALRRARRHASAARFRP
jgi:glycosyltransferase involved in cell wall biosynthesis